LLLGHIALTYFFVRLPAGTYETDLVTKVYDAMSIVFLTLALIEGAIKKLWGVPVAHMSFFWGMLTMIVSFILLIAQPETWIGMVITLAVTAAGIVALAQSRTAQEPS